MLFSARAVQQLLPIIGMGHLSSLVIAMDTVNTPTANLGHNYLHKPMAMGLKTYTSLPNTH